MAKPKVNRICCAVGCTNNSQTDGDLRFHGFPKDPETKKKWVAAVSRSDGESPWSPSSSTKLCSAHFTEDCYHQNLKLLREAGLSPKRARLRSDAVPTLSLPGSSAIELRRTEVCLEIPYFPSSFGFYLDLLYTSFFLFSLICG